MIQHHNGNALRSAFRAVAIVAAACLLLGTAPTASALSTGGEYTASFITLSGPVSGDVIVEGGSIFAGLGGFGSQSVVRIDGGVETVLADGFGSLAGFAYDSFNDRLLVGENFLGDTLYGIPSPFGSPGSPTAAVGLELLSAGTIQGFADLILDPNDPTGNTVFVSDASGSFPPNGVLLQIEISSGAVTTLQTGLEFSAGLASDGTSLFFGDSLLAGGADLSSVPVGSPSDSATLIGNYGGGLYDAEYAPDGSILITSGSSILRIDPITGASTVVASGFGFAAGLFVDDDGTIYAIDGFASPGQENRLWLIAIPEPGTGLLLAGGIAMLALRRRRDQFGSRNSN